MTTEHIIPKCDDGRQPYRMDILVNEEFAVMRQSDFDDLKEYTFSSPTGVYPGRMWKAKCHQTDQWLLRWYGDTISVGKNTMCVVHQRIISIMDWKAMANVT